MSSTPLVHTRVAVLNNGDRHELMHLLGQDAKATVYLTSLVAEFGVTHTKAPTHGCFFGAYRDDRLAAVLFVGNSPNHTTWGASESIPSLLQYAAGKMPSPRLFVGPDSHAVMIRENFSRLNMLPSLDREQTFYVLDPGSLIKTEPLDLRPGEEKDLNAVTEASAAMIEEDLLIPRTNLDFSRLKELARERIRKQKVWVHTKNGELLFKTEEVCRGEHGILVGGVYTHPGYRGRGLATRGMSTWADLVLQEIPRLALHVNVHNPAAVKAYERAGFYKHTCVRLIMSR